jgi:RNA polymerase sigma-70 factor (ECF subfamily)
MTVFVHDPDLLRRFRRGERAALAHVYDCYVGVVESLIRRGFIAATGRSSTHRVITHADLADLVQEVFVKAFAEPARCAYDGVREYRPFLIAIARNVLVDHLRRHGREVPVDILAIERLGDRDPPEPISEAPWADAHTMRVVEHYLDRLSPHEHAVYVQRYVKCCSQLEAAAALGLSRQQLRTTEARLRRGLARELARAKLHAPARSIDRAVSSSCGTDSAPIVVVEPENNR